GPEEPGGENGLERGGQHAVTLPRGVQEVLHQRARNPTLRVQEMMADVGKDDGLADARSDEGVRREHAPAELGIGELFAGQDGERHEARTGQLRRERAHHRKDAASHRVARGGFEPEVVRADEQHDHARSEARELALRDPIEHVLRRVAADAESERVVPREGLGEDRFVPALHDRVPHEHQLCTALRLGVQRPEPFVVLEPAFPRHPGIVTGTRRGPIRGVRRCERIEHGSMRTTPPAARGRRYTSPGRGPESGTRLPMLFVSTPMIWAMETRSFACCCLSKSRLRPVRSAPAAPPAIRIGTRSMRCTVEPSSRPQTMSVLSSRVPSPSLTESSFSSRYAKCSEYHLSIAESSARRSVLSWLIVWCVLLCPSQVWVTPLKP